jgi:hypothetical protein
MLVESIYLVIKEGKINSKTASQAWLRDLSSYCKKEITNLMGYSTSLTVLFSFSLTVVIKPAHRFMDTSVGC